VVADSGFFFDLFIGIFNLPNSSSHTMSLGLNQPLPEMSIINLSGGRARPAYKADNFNAICVQLSEIMEACYRDNFTFLYPIKSSGIVNISVLCIFQTISKCTYTYMYVMYAWMDVCIMYTSLLF
jgi:hypothetical protein